jgi:flagellar basal-body rod protein FlgB
MAINDLPLLSALRTRMQWHQQRQRVLAENVSNADTPNFRPRDLVPPRTEATASAFSPLTMIRTDPGHIGMSGGSGTFDTDRNSGYETRPAGNAVNLEDEMIKVAANQMDYQAVTTLYSKSLGLLKTAIGRG